MKVRVCTLHRVPFFYRSTRLPFLFHIPSWVFGRKKHQILRTLSAEVSQGGNTVQTRGLPSRQRERICACVQLELTMIRETKKPHRP